MLNQVQEIIIDQMGGNEFFVMTGSRFAVDEDDRYRVVFTLKKNASKANRFIVDYNGSTDSYDISFRRVTNGRMGKNYEYHEGRDELISEYKGAYAWDLQGYFTQVTGLHTSLTQATPNCVIGF